MEEDDAREYITIAEQLNNKGLYSKAFDLFLLAFDKNPELKALFEPEFRSTLNRMNEVLMANGKIKELITNFGRAIKAFPDNANLINETGKYLYQYGYYKEAWCHFQKALQMDPGFVNPERNLNSIKNLLVERWHYRMLNDSIRNEAYHEAIATTMIPYKDTVLDLGAGTGLLSLYACEWEPIVLTACDASEQMTTMAECIFVDNGYDRNLVINNMSTDMDYRDIGGKRSLIVTELFDSGLFGEHILQTLAHAHEKLISPVGRILPNKAEFFIIGAKCDQLTNKYQLSSAAKKIINISSANVHILNEEDTYDCDDVYNYKDLKYMTDAQSLVKIDFNDYNDIQDKLKRIEPYKADLKAVESGEVNVIIGFFTLHLTNELTVTTDPRNKKRANAWQQAVFFDFISENVAKDEHIELQFLLNGGRLTLVPNEAKKSIKRISPETVRFLNDVEYVYMIKKCLGMASVYLGQMAEMSQINIVDLCPFPLFGLLMLKRGIKSVTCCARTASDKKFFKKVFKTNKIPISRIKMLTGNEWTETAFRDEKYHAVFCNIFDICGDIDVRLYEISNYLKNGHLHRGGLFMPASISLVAQVVNSHWVDINNRVYDKNTSGYKIGSYINKYQVSQNFGIDFECLEYTPLTEPAVLGKYGHVTSGVVNVPIIKSGDANAILCWYNIELMEDLGELSTNRSNALIDGTVFLANPPVRMVEEKMAHVLRCIDLDGAFKFVIDTAEPT